jgi:hypothetical protein
MNGFLTSCRLAHCSMKWAVFSVSFLHIGQRELTSPFLANPLGMVLYNKFWITFLSYPEFWGKYDGNRRNKLIRESIFIRSIWNNIYFCKKYFVGPRDKNPAPFKLNGQSRTAFGLLKAPELQRLSVTVEVLRVGVMIVGVISVGVMNVGVLSVGVMTLSRFMFPYVACLNSLCPFTPNHMLYAISLPTVTICFNYKICWFNFRFLWHVTFWKWCELIFF